VDKHRTEMDETNSTLFNKTNKSYEIVNCSIEGKVLLLLKFITSNHFHFEIRTSIGMVDVMNLPNVCINNF
jgi:hypothetical protein